MHPDIRKKYEKILLRFLGIRSMQIFGSIFQGGEVHIIFHELM